MASGSSQGRMAQPIPGMESVIATVSGYHGSDRFKLIKLIAHTGANYVGAMAKSTTHLVCWQFAGKKYNLAKNLGTHLVNHRWFEDCLKEGKRLPEGPYTIQSGQQAGPLIWEMPFFVDTHGKIDCIRPSERSVLSDRSNIMFCDKEVDIGASLSVGYPNQPNSILIDELEKYSSYTPLRSRHRRGLRDGNTSCVESARKNRRLMKSNASVNQSNGGMLLDGGQGSFLTESSEQHENITSECADLITKRQRISSSSTDISLNFTVNRIQDLEVLDCVEDEEENHCGIKEIGNERMEKVDERGHLAEQCTSTEVSCVICWTDFSSTRGVLGCGHRFCYTCIQEWADCMAAKGKVSTCPLCKTSFTCITKVEGSASLDQKVYSQTIPCGSSYIDVSMLLDRGETNLGVRASDYVCYECHNREPEDLLLSCHICQDRWVHSYCLDPPVVPWTCIHCRDLRMLYQRFR